MNQEIINVEAGAVAANLPENSTGDRVSGELIGVKVLERFENGQAKLKVGQSKEVRARMPARVPVGATAAARSVGPGRLKVLTAEELKNTGKTQVDNFVSAQTEAEPSQQGLRNKRQRLLRRGYIYPGRGEQGGEVAATTAAQSNLNPKLRSELNQLLDLLGLENNSQNVNQLLNWLQNSSKKNVQELLEFFELNSAEVSNSTKNAARRLLKFIELSLDSRPAQKSDIFELLEKLGIQANEANLEFARILKNLEDLPTAKLLQQLFSALPELKNDSGNFSASRIKAFLFLKQNNLPVNKEILQTLDSFLNSLETSKDLPQLPRLVFTKGELAQQLKEVIRKLGFDLESQLEKDPRQAATAFRSQLQADLQDSGSEGNEHKKRFYGQLIKHSLASVAESDSVYLFVPFQVGEETKFIRMRIKDRREEEDQSRDRYWSVTLELELSQLGPLQVSLQRKEENLRVDLKAAHSSGLKLLKNNLDELRKMLAGLGYHVSISCSNLDSEEKQFIERDLLALETTELSSLDLWA